jgi:hypothetical protein
VQCNIQSTDSTAEALDHIRLVAKGADLIGWNEAATEPIRVAIGYLPDFRSFLPPGPAASVGISWRDSIFECVATNSVKVFDGVAGATPSRYINSVLLRDRVSGLHLTRVNTHGPHHVEEAGQPRVHDVIPGQNDRAKRLFALLARVIVDRAKLGPVLVGGDLNVCYLAEKKQKEPCPWFPLTTLGEVATIHMGAGPTHGRRAIDWVLTSGSLTVVSQRALPRGSSDHRPVETVVLIHSGSPE